MDLGSDMRTEGGAGTGEPGALIGGGGSLLKIEEDMRVRSL